MLFTQPPPVPCPAGLVPDATGVDAFNAAYRRAKQQRAVFVGVERQGPRWTVKADTLTAPDPTVNDSVHDAVRNTVIPLIRSRQIRRGSSAGPVYFVLYDIDGDLAQGGLGARSGLGPVSPFDHRRSTGADAVAGTVERVEPLKGRQRDPAIRGPAGGCGRGLGGRPEAPPGRR
ncbi:hypothetical protein [Streptomyces sp. NPDC127190]|uniref:hypothetical protein n=1 Tax=unclassified Streptomyces TaxID=2593676 RepID=UPI003638012E